MSKIQALQTIHDNVSDYIAEEICKLDGTFPEQMWCLPELNKALVKKVEVEEQIQLLADEDRAEEQQQLTHEFLVTKTVSNKEVRENLADWTEPIKAEYEQLVVNKKAVKPMTRTELQKMAEVQNKTLEILPAKMVHTRKAGIKEHTVQEQWCVETTRRQMTTTRTLEVLMQHRSEQC